MNETATRSFLERIDGEVPSLSRSRSDNEETARDAAGKAILAEMKRATGPRPHRRSGMAVHTSKTLTT